MTSDAYDARHSRATADLQQAMAPFERELDDPSAAFLAKLRAARVLSDADWTHVLRQLAAALRFLEGPNPTVRSGEDGHPVLDLDADPRNADWLRLAAAARKARHRLPHWAAMWLWQIGHQREPSFWAGVARVAEQMQFPRLKADPHLASQRPRSVQQPGDTASQSPGDRHDSDAP